jgi:hypothetical protein
VKVVLVILIAIAAFMAGCSSNTTTIINSQTNTSERIHQVKLSEDILKAAIADCENSPDWGIDLGKIFLNYKPGVMVTGWIVLHNSNDLERLIKLEYMPTTKIFNNAEPKATYSPTPQNIKAEWVNIGDNMIRLKRMETKAVEISILIPDGTEIADDKWYFAINADAMPINEYTQESIVTTVENDTMLELKLQKEPLLNDIKSIKAIRSDLSADDLKIADYDTTKRVLTITGFKESSERHLFVTYECGGMVTLAANQYWLLTML